MTAGGSQDASMRQARRDLIAAATKRLATAGVRDPGRDARLLMRWISGLDGAGLMAAENDPMQDAEAAAFDCAVAARAARQPLSQIVGWRSFWGRDFIVTPDVLDPRPETESLIAEALRRPARRVLDLGTGSGCILVTLLAEWREASGLGVDICDKALAVAARNAHLFDVAGRCEWRSGDWCLGLTGRFDLILSNPPYVPAHQMAGLEPEVIDHEPKIALSPGGDGLAAYRSMAPYLSALLLPHGRVIVEIGVGKAESVQAILAAAGLDTCELIPDLSGRVRAVVARA